MFVNNRVAITEFHCSLHIVKRFLKSLLGFTFWFKFEMSTIFWRAAVNIGFILKPNCLSMLNQVILVPSYQSIVLSMVRNLLEMKHWFKETEFPFLSHGPTFLKIWWLNWWNCYLIQTMMKVLGPTFSWLNKKKISVGKKIPIHKNIAVQSDLYWIQADLLRKASEIYTGFNLLKFLCAYWGA